MSVLVGRYRKPLSSGMVDIQVDRLSVDYERQPLLVSITLHTVGIREH
jgi:hypothetical protein